MAVDQESGAYMCHFIQSFSTIKPCCTNAYIAEDLLFHYHTYEPSYSTEFLRQRELADCITIYGTATTELDNLSLKVNLVCTD